MAQLNWDELRAFCRDEAAFEQLQQVLRQREAQREECFLQVARQAQQAQTLEAQRQAAETASRAKSKFLAMISHELRTPLNSILGLSALLLRQVVGPLTPKQLEYLTCIHSSGDHLLAIISDILDLSKVEAGQEHLRLTEVALPELCQSCVAMVQPRAAEKSLLLTCDVAADAQFCLADERRLRQMLLNLLSNAIKFTAQGQVSLGVRQCDRGVEFVVEDTGIGIAPDQIDHIFQPFTQIDRALNRQYEGAGLGLALTYQLARLHGGQLRVESVLGQGSRFFLYLPQGRAGKDGEAAAGHPGAAASRNHKLVIVDRDLSHHTALIAYVRACGWQVYGYEGWHRVGQHLAGIGGHPLPDLLVVGDGEARHPDLATQLRQVAAAHLPQQIPIALLWEGGAAGNAPGAGQEIQPPVLPGLAKAVGDRPIHIVPLPLTIPKVERLLSLSGLTAPLAKF